MTEPHPNILVLQKFNPANVHAARDIFADDFVWHYFNPNLPDLEGDYSGFNGLCGFFDELARKSKGTFTVNPVSATPAGDELVVVHVRNTMTLENQEIEVDAVVVWRFFNGKIVEAWDIPSAYSAQIRTIGD